MEWRSSIFSREKRAYLHTFIVIVVSVAYLLAGPQISALTGNVATTLFYYPFFRLRDKISNLTKIAEDNEALRASLVELSARLQFSEETAQENRRLRTLLGFVPPPGFKIYPAKIIMVSGAGISNTVVINLGSKQMIRENQTIIDRNGIAGRVAKVMPDYSTVYLLTEPRCRVAARVKRSRELGIVRFSMRRGMYLDNVPRQADVHIGDTIISSGLGGLFPEGLSVGVVSSVESPERGFFSDIGIAPAVNFNGLDELYVLVQEN
jgi:rod shape-determining protein MreC